jgi:ATP-dependent Clp protease ATP-binding subunit ClpX
LNHFQIPDVRTGDDIIDAVVVDEEAVGFEGRGCGAKILYGKDSLDRYLSQQKLKDLEVCNYMAGYNLSYYLTLSTNFECLMI